MWPSLDGKMQWAPGAALLWVLVPPRRGRSERVHYTGSCTNWVLGR